LLAQAKELPSLRTAVVNAGTRLTMESARDASAHALITPVFVGDVSAIETAATAIGWDIRDFEIVEAVDEEEAARRGVSLARDKQVAALMKGHVHTDVLMRAIVDRTNGIRLRRRPSHVFCMTVPGTARPLFITDAVINIAPGVRQKIDIGTNATLLLHALGIPEPKIAVLSATELARSELPSSVEAAAVAERAANGAIPGAIVDGPLSLDIAVSPQAAKIKGVNSPVAGHADVLLVPNIEAGNLLFKQMVYFMSATAAGLVVGATVPVTLTSRADPPEARLASAALASIYAANRDQQ
jgi:phosphotransacetylase